MKSVLELLKNYLLLKKKKTNSNWLLNNYHHMKTRSMFSSVCNKLYII